MANGSWACGWLWFSIGIGLLLFAIVPLVFRKFRTSYVAATAACGVLIVSFLGVRDHRLYEMMGLFLDIDRSSKYSELQLGVESGGGGIGFVFRHTKFSGNAAAHMTAFTYPVIRWNAMPEDSNHPAYPGWMYRVFDRSGFRLTWHSEPDKQAVSTALLVAGTIPNFFVIGVLTVPIVWWFYKSRWGLRKYRRAHTLCERCGYSLLGLAEPVRCPECGTHAASWNRKLLD